MIHCRKCAKKAIVIEQGWYYCCECWMKIFGGKISEHEDRKQQEGHDKV